MIAFCDLVDVDVGHLLIGGAITGIVLGLAVQPVLGNLFAGVVLLFARPYIAGEPIRVLSGAINGPHEGVVVSVVQRRPTTPASGPMIGERPSPKGEPPRQHPHTNAGTPRTEQPPPTRSDKQKPTLSSG